MASVVNAKMVEEQGMRTVDHRIQRFLKNDNHMGLGEGSSRDGMDDTDYILCIEYYLYTNPH